MFRRSAKIKLHVLVVIPYYQVLALVIWEKTYRLYKRTTESAL